jgi:hypothetical protein
MEIEIFGMSGVPPGLVPGAASLGKGEGADVGAQLSLSSLVHSFGAACNAFP